MSTQVIEIITVNKIKDLPKNYIPYAGTAEQAQAAILADRTKKPESRQFFSDINTIYQFVSLVKKGWYITAILPTPQPRFAPIIVDEQVNNGE